MTTKTDAERPKRRGRTKLDEELDKNLRKRNKHIARIAAANEWKAKKQAKLNEKFDKKVGTSPAKLATLEGEVLPSFLKRAAYWLMRRHGATIERPDGTVKYVHRKVTEVDVPANAEPGINALLAHPDGMQYLEPHWALKVKALTNAPEEIQELLRPRGFWWGPHTTVSVNSPASGKTKLLARWRTTRREPVVTSDSAATNQA